MGGRVIVAVGFAWQAMMLILNFCIIISTRRRRLVEQGQHAPVALVVVCMCECQHLRSVLNCLVAVVGTLRLRNDFAYCVGKAYTSRGLCMASDKCEELMVGQ